MNKSVVKAAGVIILLVGVSVLCLAWVFPGRMTGGGSVFVTSESMSVTTNGGTDAFRVTHGFEIHCGSDTNHAGPPPNNLEVNWPGHRFHMDNLTLGHCECNATLLPPNPPSAGFNEFIGAGTGKLDGAEGASISFIFTDQGEPGTNDTESMTIMDPGGSPVLSFGTTKLTFGNQQAHSSHGVPACNK
jgi:hypothetical protein